MGKKIFFIILIGAIIVGLGFKVLKRNPAESASLNQKKIAAGRQNQIIEKDGDNDGLKDWEEALWKTDPNNPDTDGDGTPDGEEVAKNRDPLKPGPEDELKLKIEVKNEESGKTKQPKASLTTTLGQKFLLAYLAKKQETGGKLSKEDLKNLVDRLTKESNLDNKEFDLPETYKISDIKIASEENDESTELYGKKLAEIIEKHFGDSRDSSESELKIIENAFSGQNLSELGKLNDYALNYENSANAILKLESPKSLAREHLNLINNFVKISLILKDVVNFQSDPLLGLLRYRQYLAVGQNLAETLDRLNSKFKEKVIVFRY
jgi:hypothetical protein